MGVYDGCMETVLTLNPFNKPLKTGFWTEDIRWVAYQRNCDVKFTFKGDGSSRYIGGHTLFLEVFAAIFQHEMQESQTGQVEIEDIKRNIFKELLHYIYSGQTSMPLTEETAQSLYVAADKYDVGDLKGECLQFCSSIIRQDNAVSLMAWADLHSVENLKLTLNWPTKKKYSRLYFVDRYIHKWNFSWKLNF